MLALNSYGLSGGACASPLRPSPSSGSSNNNRSRSSNNGAGVSLPRISGGGFPAARSLGKFEMLVARRAEHPLYRTTTGFDYGRYLDMSDGGALSCPKHAKHAGFTREFIAGTFQDSSLQSIDKSKQRAEAWQRKVAERTKRMQLRHDELQQQLATRQAERKLEREARREALRRRDRAARVLQQAARTFLDWTACLRRQHERDKLAAVVIQQAFRSRAGVWRAKRELQALRLRQLEGFAVRLQRVIRCFLLQRSARRELARRRESRLAAELVRRAAEEDARREAAADIQRAMRGFVARRKLQRQLSGASSVGGDGLSARGHDYGDRDAAGGSGNGRRSRHMTRRTLVAALQPGGGGAGRRRREKSVVRIQTR